MKLRTLLTALGISILLVFLAGVGLGRQTALFEAISDGYDTRSIDEYLGREVQIPDSICSSIGSQISQRIKSSTAPNRLSQELTKFQNSLRGGQLSDNTYKIFKDSALVQALELDLDTMTNDLRSQLQDVLDFNTSDIRTAPVERAAANQLKLEVDNLLRQGFTEGVSASQWESAFESKVSAACAGQINEAISGVTNDFNSDLDSYSEGLRRVLTFNWQTVGFVKLAPLVAYDSRNNADCNARFGESCASFFLEVATPCTVNLTVRFEDEDGRFDGSGSETVVMTEANKSRSVTVTGGTRSSRYYEIEEASCR